MSGQFSKPHMHRCSKCQRMFSTDAPGCRWRNRKGSPRYVHVGCVVPPKDWKPEKPWVVVRCPGSEAEQVTGSFDTYAEALKFAKPDLLADVMKIDASGHLTTEF